MEEGGGERAAHWGDAHNSRAGRSHVVARPAEGGTLVRQQQSGRAEVALPLLGCSAARILAQESVDRIHGPTPQVRQQAHGWLLRSGGDR